MSSPEPPQRPPDDEALSEEAQQAERLEAEAGNPAASNPPTGQEAEPGPTAADRDGIPAAGAPAELHSDQQPPQGEAAPDLPPDTPDVAPGTVEEGDAGAPPAAGSGAVASGSAAPPSAEPDATAPEQPGAEPPATAQGSAADQAPGDADVPSVEVHAEPSQTEAPTEAPTEPAPEPAAEPEPEPTDERRTPLLDALREHLGDAVEETAVVPGRDAWVRIRRDAWRRAAEVCRDHLGLTYFGFLSAIDWLPSPFGKSEESGLRRAGDIPVPGGPLEHGVAGGSTRFQLLARLEKPRAGVGLTLKADLPDDDLTVETWVGVYAGADWHERETAEMFGIDFVGHPNLVNIYLPGAFEGHPLRKDYPLLAREVKPWPGLVDVEPMPGEESEPAEGEEVTA